MTQSTTEQQRLEAVARSVAAKFQAFHDGLTPDEHTALNLALQQIGTPADEPADDVAGYKVVQLYGYSEAHCDAQATMYFRLWNAVTLGLGANPPAIVCEYPPDPGPLV
jgi:hypothetical protein